jgi:hypothetical protein
MPWVQSPVLGKRWVEKQRERERERERERVGIRQNTVMTTLPGLF